MPLRLLCLWLPMLALMLSVVHHLQVCYIVSFLRQKMSAAAALPNLQLLCLQEYYTSGFLSIQAAIDGYVLGLNAETETSLGPFPVPRRPQRRMEPRGSAHSLLNREFFTEWGEQSLWKAMHEHTAMVASAGTLIGLASAHTAVVPMLAATCLRHGCGGFTDWREQACGRCCMSTHTLPWWHKQALMNATCLVHIWAHALSRSPPCTWLPEALLRWCRPTSRKRCCVCTKTRLCTFTQHCCLCRRPCAGPAAQQLEVLQTAEQPPGFHTWRLLCCTAEVPLHCCLSTCRWQLLEQSSASYLQGPTLKELYAAGVAMLNCAVLTCLLLLSSAWQLQPTPGAYAVVQVLPCQRQPSTTTGSTMPWVP